MRTLTIQSVSTKTGTIHNLDQVQFIVFNDNTRELMFHYIDEIKAVHTFSEFDAENYFSIKEYLTKCPTE